MIDSVGTVRKDISDYGEKCMFDVPAIICHLNYVSSSSKVDSMIAVTEVYKKIDYPNQHYKKHNGHLILLPPDDLYDHYLELFPNLPADKTRWTIQLSSQFYSAFTEELWDKIMNDDFSVSIMKEGATKEDALEALRLVRPKSVQM